MQPDTLAQLSEAELTAEINQATTKEASYAIALYEERARRVALLNEGWRHANTEGTNRRASRYVSAIRFAAGDTR